MIFTVYLYRLPNTGVPGHYFELKVRPRRHYAGEIENAALFLQLGLPSTLISHENGAFRYRSSIRRNLKKKKEKKKKKKPPALRFSVERKHFENEAF